MQSIQMTLPTISSKFFFTSIASSIILQSQHLSCQNLGNAYDKHLKQKDATYDAIMRMVKIITNFASKNYDKMNNFDNFLISLKL